MRTVADAKVAVALYSNAKKPKRLTEWFPLRAGADAVHAGQENSAMTPRPTPAQRRECCGYGHHVHQWGQWFWTKLIHARSRRYRRLRYCVNGYCAMGQYANGRVAMMRPDRRALGRT